MGQMTIAIWAKVLLSMGLGIILTLGVVSQIGLADAPDQPAGLSEPAPSEPNHPPVLPYSYGRVVTHNVLVYETSGITPVRSLGAGYVWVSLDHAVPITRNDRAWYAINPNEFVRIEQLSLFTPSTFQGVTLITPPSLPFAWLIFDMWTSSEAGVPAGSGVPLYKRYTRVQIYQPVQ